MDIIIDCTCAGDCNGYGLIIATNADLNAWRYVAGNITGITCPSCGCTQDLADGGNCISQLDKSAPRIDGVSPVQGFSSTTATIRGHRLNSDDLVVKFGNVPATMTSRSGNLVTVIIPANVQGQAYDVSVANTNGQRASGGVLRNAFF